jgi:hypothetical protein
LESVTAEVAGSSPVVPAKPFNDLRINWQPAVTITSGPDKSSIGPLLLSLRVIFFYRLTHV